MFVGHFGIAQLGKAIRRELPLTWLLVAAYLPDIVRVAVQGFTRQSEFLSHSLPAVTCLGIAVAALWTLRGGNAKGAIVLTAACMLHWAADVFTGCKPTTMHGPWLGLVSYRRPVSDLLLEGSLLAAGWFITRRRGCGIGKKWLALGFFAQVVFLLSMYNGAEFFIGNHEWTWNPKISIVPQPHVVEQTPCRAPTDS
jgi:hypothetical protein